MYILIFQVVSLFSAKIPGYFWTSTDNIQISCFIGFQAPRIIDVFYTFLLSPYKYLKLIIFNYYWARQNWETKNPLTMAYSCRELSHGKTFPGPNKDSSAKSSVFYRPKIYKSLAVRLYVNWLSRFALFIIFNCLIGFKVWHFHIFGFRQIKLSLYLSLDSWKFNDSRICWASKILVWASNKNINPFHSKTVPNI